MAQQRIGVGINGFGRIGRVLARLIAGRDDLALVAVNDLTEDVDNLVYLYNYDSTYGRAAIPARREGMGARIGTDEAAFFCSRDPRAVPWAEAGVSVLIEATGVRENIALAREAMGGGRLGKVVVTHAPKSGVDCHIIMGVNHGDYDPARHHVVASSICDANAIAHPLACLEAAFGIREGMVTTLHPWLNYQNLLDGPVASVANPGHVWKDYALGRASEGTLIPKNTTAVEALRPVLPGLPDRLHGFSYRTPTGIVSSADMTIGLARPVDDGELCAVLRRMARDNPFVAINEDSLVGCDYKGQTHSAVIDLQWAKAMGSLVKIVVWYDNEWGYSSRVCDVAAMVGGAAREGGRT